MTTPIDPDAPGGAGRGLPEIPGPWTTAKLAWRRLRRMSTAILLLFALAAASVIATFVPQEPLIPTTVADWRSGAAGPGADVSRVLDALGLFDLFGSWWFALLVALLFTSLTGCLVPRGRGFWRAVRRPPAAGRNLDRLSSSVEVTTGASPEAARDVAAAVLARRRFRRRLVEAADGVPQLAAERGHWREGGSLLFHGAFYLLLVGALIGGAFGFVGQVNIPEGRSFSDTRIGYDLAEPGRFFGLEDHRGFVVRLDEFAVSYYDDNVPRDFVSRVTILEDGQEVEEAEARVNHPVVHRGMKLYQARFGMAPRVVVRAGDRVLHDDVVMLSDQGGFVWTGAAKVVIGDPTAPEPPPQVALELVFLPDAALGRDGQPFSRSPEAVNPRLIALLHVGELGLERPVPASRADLSPETVVGPPAILAEGASAEMAGDAITVEFAELRMWSGFQVSHAPGRWLLLAAAALLLSGLLPSLYSYRRRIWVEARPEGAATRVRLAGVALHRKSTFADEFERIRVELLEALPAASSSTPDPLLQQPQR